MQPQPTTLKMLANALEVEVHTLAEFEDPDKEHLESRWLLLLHGSPLIGFVFPFSVLFPLFIWVYKRGDNVIYNEHGVHVINFQLNMTLIYILAMISLITIKKWGVIFFMSSVPFNFAIVILNVFTSILSRSTFYPKLIPFLTLKKITYK